MLDRAAGRSLVYKFLISSVFSAPCLVVAHHEFFKNEGQAVIEFVEKLSSFIYQCHEKGVGYGINSKNISKWLIASGSDTQSVSF
jgi:hypothetical protein